MSVGMFCVPTPGNEAWTAVRLSCWGPSLTTNFDRYSSAASRNTKPQCRDRVGTQRYSCGGQAAYRLSHVFNVISHALCPLVLKENREGLAMTSRQVPRAFSSSTIDARFSTKPRRWRFHAVSRTPSAPLRTERLRVYRVQLPAPLFHRPCAPCARAHSPWGVASLRKAGNASPFAARPRFCRDHSTGCRTDGTGLPSGFLGRRPRM